MRAIVREVSTSFDRCELTHLAREPIDLVNARAQHREYVDTLMELGCAVTTLPPLDEFADSVFVEDVGVVLEKSVVLTRPGAESRRGEVEAIADAVGEFRSVVERIEEPGTVDGGDVLVVGGDIFIGVSTRTNVAGAEQLAVMAESEGLRAVLVPMESCLHLKSAVTALSETQVLLSAEWLAADYFDGLEVVKVHRREAGAANVLRVGEGLMYPTAAYPRTARIIEDCMPPGVMMYPVENSEFRKAEGALTCCSLIF